MILQGLQVLWVQSSFWRRGDPAFPSKCTMLGKDKNGTGTWFWVICSFVSFLYRQLNQEMRPVWHHHWHHLCTGFTRHPSGREENNSDASRQTQLQMFLITLGVYFFLSLLFFHFAASTRWEMGQKRGWPLQESADAADLIGQISY